MNFKVLKPSENVIFSAKIPKSPHLKYNYSKTSWNFVLLVLLPITCFIYGVDMINLYDLQSFKVCFILRFPDIAVSLKIDNV